MSTVSQPYSETLSTFLAAPKQLFIDGRWLPAVDGATFEVVNPSTTETIAHVADGKAEDINVAVKAARHAFDSGPWTKMSPSDRGKTLRTLLLPIAPQKSTRKPCQSHRWTSAIP